jgi:uncharacterized protein YbjQ (UPF0145 family)
MEDWTNVDLRQKPKSDLESKLSELDKLPWKNLSEEEKALRNEIVYVLNNPNTEYEKESLDEQKRLSIENEAIQKIKITTTNNLPNREIEEVLDVITSECVFGMNVFRDFFAGMTDFFGGRSKASQKILRDARNTCLYELKKEAHEMGGDGIIGIDLDYSEISGKGKGMLFLVASGTVVKFKK